MWGDGEGGYGQCTATAYPCHFHVLRSQHPECKGHMVGVGQHWFVYISSRYEYDWMKFRHFKNLTFPTLGTCSSTAAIVYYLVPLTMIPHNTLSLLSASVHGATTNLLICSTEWERTSMCTAGGVDILKELCSSQAIPKYFSKL